MKRLALFIALLFIAGVLHAETHWTFRALQFNYFAYNYTDAVVSYVAITQGKAIEANPIARCYIKHPVVFIPIVTISNVVTYDLSNYLYKKSKVVAYIVMIGLNVIKGYIVYRAIDVLNN